MDNIFYKYRTFDVNALATLQSGLVWFSTHSDLNDPFDCDPEVEIDISDEEVDEYFAISGVNPPALATSSDKQEILQSTISELANSGGVFCVSEKSKDELMWAHYGDNHRGIAIGFHIPDKNLHRSDAPHLHPNPVKYDGRGKVLASDMLSYVMNRPDSKAEFESIMTASYFSKNPAWKYESEYRFLAIRNSGLVDLEAELFSIHYGLRFDESKKKLIDTIVADDVKRYAIEIQGTELIEREL